VSFDIFLQAFDDPTPTEGTAALRLATPYLEGPASPAFSRLVFPDGATDVYGLGGSHLMFNHTSGHQALDLIVAIARAERWAILLPGCPTAVTDPALIPDLPEELRPDATTVTNGTDLQTLLSTP
jgi:hypothetical protein